MNSKLKHIQDRIAYLKKRRKELREEIPELESKRDWADTHESAQIWYHANVAVNQAKREVKRIEKELLELDRDRVELEMRSRRTW